MKGRRQLEVQLSENSLVKEELDRLDTTSTVYKMIGPVLVKQELEDSRQNVKKRMDYINGEIKRHEDLIKDLDKKQEDQKEVLQKLQTQFQLMQQKSAKA